MDLGLMYAIVAFICMLLVGVIFNRTLATEFKETIDRPFYLLLRFFLLFCMVDGVWGLFSSPTLLKDLPFYAKGYEIFTYGFHYMAAVSAFVWSGYLFHYMTVAPIADRVLKTVRTMLLTTQFILLTSNLWNHKVFIIDAYGIYRTFELRPMLFWLQFSYYIIVTLCAVALGFHKGFDGKERIHSYRSAVVFASVPLIAGVFQLIFPDAAMYSIGFMVSAVVIYSFNITAQREQYLNRQYRDRTDRLTSLVSGLSGDYKLIVYLDLETAAYDIFRQGELSGESENKRHEDFFADCGGYIAHTVHASDIAFVKEMLSKIHILDELRDKSAFSFNFRMIRDGEIRYHMIKVIRSSADGRVILGLFDDDERVRGEMEQQEQLRKAREDAESASRAKTRFLFNMSHDIRTPMNAILGFTGIARKSIGDDARVLECLDKVQFAGDHLLSIINDVLDMSRIENEKVEIEEKPMSLGQCFDGIVDIVRSLADAKNITLDCSHNDLTHDAIYGDEVHLSRVILNVLTNSVKYTPDGGRIEGRVEELPCEKAGHARFRVTITDNGIGMSKEFLSHIYETFSRERNSTMSGVQGTGLGMAITKNLTDMMGGTIDIDSELNKGTKVEMTFTFRQALDVVEEVTGEIVADAAEIIKGKRALYVEDNELNREIMSDILDDLGVIAEAANDGTEAVEKCRALLSDASLPRYDCILMDVQMPIMDGYTATKEIRALGTDYFLRVPIVAMTANVFAEDVRRSREAGMNGHLGKPVNTDELTRVMAALISGKHA